ncbi:hypothetical protein HK104_005113, partial [Borealophlyctis nickersoniae]
CSLYTTVQSGQGCWAIANANGIVDYHVFDTLNIGVNCDSTALQVGRRLCIQPCLRKHTVASGQGCYAVAQQYGLQSYTTIDTMNPGVKCDSTGLEAGRVICVKICTKYVRVLENDVCYDVATRNGLTTAAFQALNPGLNCDDLQTGQAVCVAASK